ncbi:hypothetical protein SAMN05421812_12518 [Asanoa hainanensis]|uniref:Uncharacterized protein n=1 Tax=Asanoa hainanensis TaxID=560556 RepID=A0A239PFR7_9ACTN|nr:hypothetical protein [Asanoa hainanensis]SNT65675.1 hypothetical protein SAMN05421812_12518 [Asanoa hainanensis]
MPVDAATRQTRFTHIRPTLLALRQQIRDAIDVVHPDAAACLPLPDFELPERYTLAALAPALHRGLFNRRGGVSDAWRRAFDACPHAGRENAIAARELTYLWYQVVCRARYYAESTPGRTDDFHYEKTRIPKRIAAELSRVAAAPRAGATT